MVSIGFGLASDRLLPSDRDTITLSQEVEERFKNLCGAYLRIKGEALAPPSTMDADFFRWRTMAVRQGRGDFRNTRSELLSLRAVAQWTCDINCDIRLQPRKLILWKD